MSRPQNHVPKVAAQWITRCVLHKQSSSCEEYNLSLPGSRGLKSLTGTSHRRRFAYFWMRFEMDFLLYHSLTLILPTIPNTVVADLKRVCEAILRLDTFYRNAGTFQSIAGRYKSARKDDIIKMIRECFYIDHPTCSFENAAAMQELQRHIAAAAATRTAAAAAAAPNVTSAAQAAPSPRVDSSCYYYGRCCLSFCFVRRSTIHGAKCICCHAHGLCCKRCNVSE